MGLLVLLLWVCLADDASSTQTKAAAKTETSSSLPSTAVGPSDANNQQDEDFPSQDDDWSDSDAKTASTSTAPCMPSADIELQDDTDGFVLQDDHSPTATSKQSAVQQDANNAMNARQIVAKPLTSSALDSAVASLSSAKGRKDAMDNGQPTVPDFPCQDAVDSDSPGPSSNAFATFAAKTKHIADIRQ